MIMRKRVHVHSHTETPTYLWIYAYENEVLILLKKIIKALMGSQISKTLPLQQCFWLNHYKMEKLLSLSLALISASF